jgi:hypothetical protein
MQGGNNEMVVHRMYTSLELAQRKNLHIHYYVAKDQVRPINAKFKQRDSHSLSLPPLYIPLSPFLTVVAP